MAVYFKVQNNGNDCISSENNSVKTQLCTISVRNMIAFCKVKTNSYLNSYIYVCDILTPWQQFEICSSPNAVEVINWNRTGELLLVGYENGDIDIWESQYQTINSWYIIYKANLQNENIIASAFFHNGKHLNFNWHKREQTSYVEKFERDEFRPTLKQFGMSSSEGVIIVTSSGLLGVFTIPKLHHNTEQIRQKTAQQLNIFTHCLSLSRNYINHCSISHLPSGRVNIVVSCGWQESIIESFEVQLTQETKNKNIIIKSESLPNLLLSNSTKTIEILDLKSLSIKNETVIFLAYKDKSVCTDSYVLEQWNLSKKHKYIHKLLQNKNKNDVYNYTWEKTVSSHFSASIIKICLPKFMNEKSQIYLILKNNTVHALEFDFKKVGMIAFDKLISDQPFNSQLGQLVTGDMTQMDQFLIIFDTYGQMYAIQSSFNLYSDKSFKMNSLLMQVSLLEYCILTGSDGSDILVSSSMSLDVLLEKLNENFNRQSAVVRQFYYSNFLLLKSNLCRMQSKIQDFDYFMMLHFISTTFKSLLRPSDLSSQDKGPADNLAIILSEPSLDVDKVLFNLDAKDFTVEPMTLQSLQQLIQWVADLSLYILNKLPNDTMKLRLHKKQGYDISKDIAAISTLRELLVMIRIWGLLNSQCLPIYSKSTENFDVLSNSFRLLTRLAQNSLEPDEQLLDESSSLSTQIILAPKQPFNAVTLFNFQITNRLPIKFTKGIEPISPQEGHNQEIIFCGAIKDCINNLYMGCKQNNERKCIRCGLISNIQNTPKTTALKAWCLRWQHCYCGGLWKNMKLK